LVGDAFKSGLALSKKPVFTCSELLGWTLQTAGQQFMEKLQLCKQAIA